jgi:dolichol-phosphate mannosyltransferase
MLRPVNPLLSIVVPCFNEEAVIVQTLGVLGRALQAIPDIRAEIVCVDDGSADATMKCLRNAAETDSRLRVVALSRNFGHQLALTAGLDAARGDAVVVIDADLQDPPEVIEGMVARWKDGVDVVFGVRTLRSGETAFKRGTAHLFYRLMRAVSSSDIPMDAGDFRLMDRAVVDALRTLPERDRFVRGLVSWVGFRQEGIPYERHARAGGETKYPFRRMLRFALDGIFSFSAMPLRLATYLGLFVSFASVVGIGYALWVRFFVSSVVPGWAGQWIGTMFLGGVQLLSLGIIGEYVGRIYGEVKSRPLYVVRERIGF